MTDSANIRFSGTQPVDERFRFNTASLENWMREHVTDFSGNLAVRQFKGGQSNPTYLLSEGTRCWVLRRKPPGKLLASAHAVDREYRVLAALEGSEVPVAIARGLCLDETVIGTAFYIMDYVEGRIFWDSKLPECERTDRAAIFAEMNRVLGALHRIDLGAHSLSDYGRPGNYFVRQIDRWSRQYQSSPAGRIEAIERLISWLSHNVPNNEEVALVHGDYRIDNLIFDPREPRILAVLDWELSTLGHPLADLAYHCLPWHLPRDDPRSLSNADWLPPGIPSEHEYVATYCQHMGRGPIDPRDWTFCIAFSLFRIAAILHGISGRVAVGTAASAHAKETGRGAVNMAELAWQTIASAGHSQ